MSTLDNAVIDRVRGALWGIFIGDALAMPVHWFYNPDDIKRAFGSIKHYEAPPQKHPSSIMSLHSTGGSGRGSQSGHIIGDVINHGKRAFWGIPQMHYHQGMQAGENTLNAICARVAMRSITAGGGRYDAARWLEDYVGFMTTPGSHNDTYAESFHRDFFSNYSKGVAPEKCAGSEGHDTAQIGGFVTLPPVIASAFATASGGGGATAAQDAALTHLRTTHHSKNLEAAAQQFTVLLTELLGGTPTGKAITSAGLAEHVRPQADDLQVVYGVYGPACYIASSLPVTVHMLSKYDGDFEAGVLANANAGGENCHRGAAVGALLGAAVGEAGVPDKLKKGLHDYEAIKKEIDAFTSALQMCTPRHP